MALTGKPSNLHDLAVHISSDIHTLVTGLAHAGVDPAATAKVSKMADSFGQIAKQLAAAPIEGQQPQDQQPQQAQPQQGPGGPQGMMAQGGPQEQPQQPGTLDQATSALHHAMVQQANRHSMSQ